MSDYYYCKALFVLVVFATPFVSSLILMCILFFVQGTAQSFTDLGKSISFKVLLEHQMILLLGGTNILLTMWGVNAAAPLNTAHLGYGIGAVLVNLLIRPFINQKDSSPNNEGVNSTLLSVNEIRENSNIVIPYSITAILCVLTAVGHAFFYVRALKTRREKLEIREVIRNQSERIV